MGNLRPVSRRLPFPGPFGLRQPTDREKSTMCPPDEMDPQELQAREEMTGQWPGQFLLDELQLAEMRAILWAHLEGGTTQAAVAREIGMSPHKLGDFLRGVVLHHGENWDRVAHWCAGRPHPRVAARPACAKGAGRYRERCSAGV